MRHLLRSGTPNTKSWLMKFGQATFRGIEGRGVLMNFVEKRLNDPFIFDFDNIGIGRYYPAARALPVV